VNQPLPPVRSAELRDASVLCPHCQRDIRMGEEVASCPACGTVQHVGCWTTGAGCGSWECAPGRRASSPAAATLKISDDDLAVAAPLPPTRPVLPTVVAVGVPPDTTSRPRGPVSRLAVLSLVVALLGIPLFIAVTLIPRLPLVIGGMTAGLLAVLLGSVALAAVRRRQRRGMGLAIGGVLMGMVDMAGCMLALVVLLPHATATVNLEFEPDMAALAASPPHIKRAMLSSVLVKTRQGLAGLGGFGIGSGVILRINNQIALVVTNRHVIDPDFSGKEKGPASPPTDTSNLSVKLIGQEAQPGTVVWLAPDGIDLALLEVPIVGAMVEAALWSPKPVLAIGADVFAIGNPHQLEWTYTKGVISQLRRHQRHGRQLRVIQTNADINQGNSGGGLYGDKDGTLLGINTWTNDKRVSEGLSFAIAFESLLELNPPHLARPLDQHDPDEADR